MISKFYKDHEVAIRIGLIFIVWCVFGSLIVNFTAGGLAREATKKAWFVSHLRYDFSAVVDTAIVFERQHADGRIFCTPSRDIEMDYWVEDSLRQRLSWPYRFRFLWWRKSGQVNFRIWGGQIGKESDSVYVNSKQNTIQFFKTGVPIGTREITTSLE